MNIEDAVRAAMRAHEGEAPTAAEFTPRTALVRAAHGHSRWLLPAAAAACVLAVAGALVAIDRTGGHGKTLAAPSVAATTTPSPTVASAVLSCPAAYQQPVSPAQYWVPQLARGVDGASRLVPLDTPGHVVVCAYLHGDKGELTGAKQLTGDLSAVPSMLAWMPGRLPNQGGACPDYIALTDGDNYLLGISYPTGTLWVSVPGSHCSGVGNGEFQSTRNLRAVAQASYGAGSWQVPASPKNTGCPQAAGRLGQEHALVPSDPVSVQVCEEGATGSTTTTGRVVTGAQVAALAAALNALPTTVGSGGFTCPGATPSTMYDLTFGYAQGPALLVTIVADCHPAIDNGSLQADDAATVLPLVQTLLD